MAEALIVIEEHDENLVWNWNELDVEDDEVYILGDVMLKHNLPDMDFSYGIFILERL